MSLWGIITGAGKVGDAIDTGLDVVKMGARGLDAMVYTDEEKAETAAARQERNGEMAYKFAKMRQGESGASAVTRRAAMYIVLGNFTVFCQTALVFTCLGRKELAADIVKLAIALSIGSLAMTVVASLFGYYAWTKGKKK